MLFRIVEFKEPQTKGSDNRFFVQQGTVVKEPLFLGINARKTVWDWLREENGEVIGHKTFSESLALIEELKKQIPEYHYIK